MVATAMMVQTHWKERGKELLLTVEAHVGPLVA
jgi:hypothetical protein